MILFLLLCLCTCQYFFFYIYISPGNGLETFALGGVTSTSVSIWIRRQDSSKVTSVRIHYYEDENDGENMLSVMEEIKSGETDVIVVSNVRNTNVDSDL